jgi:hypothetical protein
MKILFFLLLSVSAFGQAPGAKDIALKPSDWNIQQAKYNVQPGDRLVMQPGTYGAMEFHDLQGTKENPITITSSGKVLISRSGTGGRVVEFFNCKYIRFTGTENNLIEITGGGHGVTASNLSNHVEFDHLYIHHAGYSGIDITNYPTCDPSTWRGATIMEDIIVHDNKIMYLTDGEAIYIGPSHYGATFPLSGCSSGITSALEPDVSNVQVYNNYIDNVGADGIQVGGVTGGKSVAAQVISGTVHHNQVYNTGIKKVINQASGIQANPGSALLIEDNIVDGCTCFGIILQGRTCSIVRRNEVRNTVGALFTVAREADDKGKFQVYDNKFTSILPSPAGYGVEVYSDTDFQDDVLQMVKGTMFRTYGTAKINTAPRTIIEQAILSIETTGGVVEVYAITPSGSKVKIK